MGLRVLRDVIVVYPRKPNPLGLALNGSTRKVRIKACIQPNKPTNSSNTHNEQHRANESDRQRPELGRCLYTHFAALLAIVILRRVLDNSVNRRQITPTVFSRESASIITRNYQRQRTMATVRTDVNINWRTTVVCMSGLAQESVGLLESIPHITLLCRRDCCDLWYFHLSNCWTYPDIHANERSVWFSHRHYVFLML